MRQDLQGAPWARTAAALALFGATLGVALDAAHVASGTTRYAAPWLLGVAIWTPPLFAASAVGLGLGPALLERALGVRRSPPTGVRAGQAMGVFVGAYLLSCVLRGPTCAAILAILAVLLWRMVDGRAIAAAHAAVAGVAGVAVEATLVRAGAFVHADAALLGVPLWLPCLYACASLAVHALARRLLVGASPSPTSAARPGARAVADPGRGS